MKKKPTQVLFRKRLEKAKAFLEIATLSLTLILTLLNLIDILNR